MVDAFTCYMLQSMHENEKKWHFLNNILPKELDFIFAPTVKDVYAIMAKHQYVPEDFMETHSMESRLNDIIRTKTC